MVLNALTRRYLTQYLVDARGCSENTVASYRKALALLVEFMETAMKIPRDRIKVEDFSFSVFNRFLDWLEARKSSVSTRNARLAALKSFFRFISLDQPEYLDIYKAVHAIKCKKKETPVVKWLGIKEIKAFFGSFDMRDKDDLGDLAILMLLYESGARVSELIGLRRHDLKTGADATVTVTGKGRKKRIIPLNKKVSDILVKYCKAYNVNDTDMLFFNARRQKLTRQGVTYTLDKHIKEARGRHPGMFKGKIPPHCLRHSKAMHLLEKGMQLHEIRDFLGHNSVMTTEIYAKTNPEIKRSAINKYTEELNTKEYYSKEEAAKIEDWLEGKS